jgi:hypothetical protein
MTILSQGNWSPSTKWNLALCEYETREWEMTQFFGGEPEGKRYPRVLGISWMTALKWISER